MTIFAETSCRVLPGYFRFRPAEKVIARQELPPGDYTINHDPAHVEIRVGQAGNRDSLTLLPKSVRRIESARGEMNFAGSALLGVGMLAGLPADEITIVPKLGQRVLRLGPNIDGVILSLVSLPDAAHGEPPLGEKTLSVSIQPKTPNPEPLPGGGGSGGGIAGG